MGLRIRRYEASGSLVLERLGFRVATALVSARAGVVCRPGNRPPSMEPRAQEVLVVQAYILIQTEVGKAAAVAREVREIKGVTEAEDVTGPYDVIVRAEAKNVDELGKLVVASIQGVEGITRTLTCPVVHL
jgi:DNA-binding Lrp family transcriptional regulator